MCGCLNDGSYTPVFVSLLICGVLAGIVSLLSPPMEQAPLTLNIRPHDHRVRLGSFVNKQFVPFGTVQFNNGFGTEARWLISFKCELEDISNKVLVRHLEHHVVWLKACMPQSQIQPLIKMNMTYGDSISLVWAKRWRNTTIQSLYFNNNHIQTAECKLNENCMNDCLLDSFAYLDRIPQQLVK